MPVQVSGAINADTAEPITVFRKTDGGYVDGVWVEGSESSFPVLASVQQPSPKQLEVLPEGERSPDVKLFISLLPIYTSNDFDDTEADHIEWNGKRYKANSSGDWSSYGQTTVLGTRVK